METKEYERLCERWEEWKKRETVYWNKRREYIRTGKEYLLDKLDKDYGHDGFNSLQFGPHTIIDNPADLLNPNFILPGVNLPFCQLKNTDQNIPLYFGKTLCSELMKCEGIVTGYSYDSSDDYIRIRLENGKEHFIITNSHYHIKGENNEEGENL